ncbi:MAG: hypothetical protein HFJ09_15760 [Lachnospiraceae bacterium]|nr:hypothetical protein [Lachnospiraceae bacterium]
MNEWKDVLDSRLKDITFSQQMKNKVLEECRQSRNAGQKNRHFYRRALVPITFFLVFCISITVAIKGLQSNEMAGEKVLLVPNIEYSQYDVTGDGETDIVKVKIKNIADNEESGEIQVFVNDKIVFEQKREWSPGWNVQLIKLANGKVFFDIESEIGGDSNCIHQLYSFEGGKLKSIYDFQKYYSEYAERYHVDVSNVSGNTLETAVIAQFYITGFMQFDMKLDYKGEKFEKISNTFTPNYKAMSMENKWTADKTTTVYKNVGSKKIAYTLKKGNAVKLNKIIYEKNKVYFQLENNKGENGYIASSKSAGYFNEARVSQ